MQSPKSLILTNIYFGKPPAYFDLFLESCARNPDIDFLFITDFPAPVHASNVRFVHMTFGAFRDRVASHFDFPVALDSPYKICDFRPAFGDVLGEYFSGYAYWGHCDFDMVFGCLDEVLETLTRDTPDKLYRRGHLTIYRNVEAVNAFYRSEAGQGKYREVFATPAFCIFDETNGIDALFRAAGFRVQHEEIIYDVKPNSPYLQKTSSAWGVGQYCLIGANGVTAHNFFDRRPRSYAYVHLQKRKPSLFGTRCAGDVLYLDQFGFRWVRPAEAGHMAWRALVPNLLHVWQRLQRGMRRR